MEKFGQDLLLLERLAAGGMAEVYRAKQLGYGGFEKTLAVKRILPHYAANEEFKNMFRMEANLSGQLQHPNIAQVFGNGDAEGYLYLLMEFIDGRNLRQLLARTDKRKTKIPIEVACSIVSEAAKGLHYAHEFIDEKTGQALAIVHRDMSPQNIMLSFDGAVKIVDFGIAKAAARVDMTRAGVLKGKFGYMSPEQAQGEKLDRRTDIFALGIVLFELLTQRRLFTCDDDMRTLQLVRECRVPRPSRYNPAVSPALDRIVLKALARDRAERYLSGADLYADLHHLMNQAFPKFLSTDISKFLREVFAEDIAEDRRRREKMAAEAPARIGVPAARSEASPARASAEPQKRRSSEEPDTFYELDDHTDVSEETIRRSQAPEIKVISDPQVTKISQISEHELLTGAVAEVSSEEESVLPPPREPLEADEGVQFGSFSATTTPGADFEKTSPGTQLLSSGNLSLSLAEDRETSVALRPARSLSTWALDGAHRMLRPLGVLRPSPSGSNYRIPLYGAAALFIFFVYQSEQATQTPLPASAPQQESAPAVVGLSDEVPERVALPDSQPESVTVSTTIAPPALEKSIVAEQLNAPPQTPEPIPPPPPLPVVLAPPPELTPAPSLPPPPSPPRATSLASERSLPVKPKSLAVSRVPLTREVETPFRDVASAPLTGPLGYLTIESTPRATEIYLDGTLLRSAQGEPLVTPVLRLAIPPGHARKIRLQNSVFNVRWESSIDIVSDKILSLNPTLK